MTFNTSTTIKEQVDYVKKYGLIIQFKKLTVFQCVALIALLIDFIDNLVNHSYFLCAFDIFLFIGLMFYLTIRIRKNIKIPDSISSGSTLNLCTTIKFEITGKEIILILPNKTIIDNLAEYIEFIVIKNGILLITDVQNQKKWYSKSKKCKSNLYSHKEIFFIRKEKISQTILWQWTKKDITK